MARNELQRKDRDTREGRRGEERRGEKRKRGVCLVPVQLIYIRVRSTAFDIDHRGDRIEIDGVTRAPEVISSLIIKAMLCFQHRDIEIA